MSMVLTLIHGENPTTVETAAHDLTAATNIPVPSFGWAAVAHDVKLTEVGAHDMVWSIPYLRTESGLFVEAGILTPTDPTAVLVTRVFNLTSKTIKIKRGTTLARLLCTTKE